ncbi:GNAT family N-acetyltransferase [Promicromonospora sukumoe]|uniref:GNAT family N-acetyltransferase n=1 Tax=Promicromonospora sukumoe TaxID=88382 RepID=UPI000365E1E2|nr:GNAT family protein [Promicromonospora sukumoe]
MQHDLRLAAHGVRLEPLAHEHAPALAGLVDAQLWAGMTSALPDTVPAMEAYVDAALAAPDHLAFAVLGPDGEVRGSTRFYELSARQRRVEIGSTFYGRDWWAGATNPACKLMLLRHAFEVLELRRVALRCDARNTRSRAAILKLGAQEEGRLRAHRIAPDGSEGDTLYFSILSDEWPGVREGLETRLTALTAVSESR